MLKGKEVVSLDVMMTSAGEADWGGPGVLKEPAWTGKAMAEARSRRLKPGQLLGAKLLMLQPAGADR